MDTSTARGYVQRDLDDESAVRWSTDQIDRAVLRALDEYSLAWPLVASLDVVKGSTDTLDMTAASGWSSGLWLYALWCEYPTGNAPATAIRFREERRGYLRVIESDQPVQGDTVRAWYAKGRALADVESEHEDLVCLGAAGYAALSAGSGAIGAVNVSGWTPRQYMEWGRERVAEFKARLRALGDTFSSGAPAVVWSSANV